MNLSHHSSPLQLFHISLHSPNNNSLFITIPIIGILATTFLLISYYTFVIKCFLNPNHTNNTIISSYFNPFEQLHARKGLEEYFIRSLPIIKFQKVVKQRVQTEPGSSRPDPDTSYECSVCLNEFEDGEKLRVIPICCHAFHIDCIDIWLQSNASCPLCRSGISPGSVLVPDNNFRILSREDDGFVVFEIQGNNNIDEPRLLVCSSNNNEMGSGVVGNEWIDIKGKDCEFRVDDQLIRRSVSMDLSIDREFLIEIQRSCSDGIAHGELCSNSSGTKLRK